VLGDRDLSHRPGKGRSANLEILLGVGDFEESQARRVHHDSLRAT